MGIFHLLFCVLLVLFQVNVCSAKDWRGIVPLHSSRADVARLLGIPVLSGGLPTYDLPNETVSIFYSEYACGDKMNFDQWNVPRDTVLGITVRPKTKVQLKDLLHNLKDFKKEEPAGDIRGYYYYVNKEDGLTIEVFCQT